MPVHTRKRSAFSLIELVIVVVIIGIIAAIAIPRMSRGAVGAGESTLVGDLAVLRKALDLYAAEHNGNYPDNVTTITNQLLEYTDISGAPVAASDGTHIYGPYLRALPVLTVGTTNRGSSAITDTAGTSSCGWVYDKTAHTIVANTPESDVASKAYNTY